MQDVESRSLRRAAAVLALVSLIRWGWPGNEEPLHPDAPDVLPELLAATEDSIALEERRARPLEPGERIDPNRADAVELDRLPGIGPATALAIVAARDSGLLFHTPSDLLLVRGIGSVTLERLRGYLDLSRPPPRAATTVGARSERFAPRVRDRPAVDVNRAGALELQSLPGIGPAIAERIVAAREERMFRSVEELTRVRGIGPATVQRLRGYATVGPSR